MNLAAVDRDMARDIPEWLYQEPVEPNRRATEGIHADGHGSVTHIRLCPVCTKEAIPPGQVEAEVARRLLIADRVVNPMHVGRDDQPPQPRSSRSGTGSVRVVEHRRRVEQYFEGEYGDGGAPIAATVRALDRRRKDQNLQWMKRVPVVTSNSRSA